MTLPEGIWGFVLLAGMAGASYLLLRASRRAWKRSQTSSASPQQIQRSFVERSRDTALADAPPDVLRWHVELHETARDLKAEIDTKLATLNALTLIAREQADRLEVLLKETRRAKEAIADCGLLIADSADKKADHRNPNPKS